MLSIPEYVMKKNQSRGPGHGPSVRETMNHKARDMLREAKNANNGHCQAILERWYKDAKYRSKLSEHGRTEEQSDNTTHLLWKTIPIMLHLQQGDDGRRTGTLFFKKKENKVR